MIKGAFILASGLTAGYIFGVTHGFALASSFQAYVREAEKNRQSNKPNVPEKPRPVDDVEFGV